jgi:hypothetical protein
MPTALPTIVGGSTCPSTGGDGDTSERCSALFALLPPPPPPLEIALALAAVGTATLVWNVARAGDTGGFPAAAGLLPGIDLAVDCAGFVGAPPFSFGGTGCGIRGGTRARTTGEFAGVGAPRRASSVSSGTLPYSYSGTSSSIGSAPFTGRVRGGEIGIDLLVGDVGFFGDDVDLLLLTADLGGCGVVACDPGGVADAVEPELDVELAMEYAGDTNSGSREMRTTGEFAGVCELRTCIPRPRVSYSASSSSPSTRPAPVRTPFTSTRGRVAVAPLDPEFDVESPPSDDAVASLPVLLVVLTVLAVPVLALLTTLAGAPFSGLTLTPPSGLTLPCPPRRIPFTSPAYAYPPDP